MENNERIRIGDRMTIYRRGMKGVWCADFWFEGEHRRTSLKTRNKKIATQRAVKLDSELIDGKYQRPPSSKSIRSAIDDYLAHLQTEDRARKTIVRYRGELNTFCEICLRQKVRCLAQITPTLFDCYRAQMKEKHTAKTLYHESMVIKQFMKWCKSRHLISENPLLDYKLDEPRLVPKPGPTLDETWKILNSSKLNLKTLLATLAFTGMRSGELQRLRKDDVEFTGNWIHIVSRDGAETKTGDSRKVPIHPVLKEMLEKQMQLTGPWFFVAEPSPSYPAGDHWINTKKLNERFQKTAKALGMMAGRQNNGYVIHSFRHFFETHCVNSGIPQRVIDTWLGHRSDKSMAAVYYKLSDKESQAFMRKVPFNHGESAVDADDQNKEDVK
jgi:integrase